MPAPTPPQPSLQLRLADGGPAACPAGVTGALGIRSARRLLPGEASRAAGTTVAVQPDDVVRVVHDNGLVLWLRADDLVAERGRAAPARGDGTPAWDIDAGARVGLLRDDAPATAQRGLLGLGISALEVFGVDLKGQAAAAIGAQVEQRRLQRPPGLYRVALAPTVQLSAVADGPATLATGRPVLLFLHGTLSSFAGSYGDLAEDALHDARSATALLRAQITQRYEGEVYAFEHFSLTHSPIRNALDLVAQLPDRAELHLVSHSRGGLLGELLTLAQRDQADGDPLRGDRVAALFAAGAPQAPGLPGLGAKALAARQASYDEQARQLAQLVQLLDAKRITVSRFVRVACPARGTTLASGRLDRWLSVIANLLPDGLFADAVDFLLAVVQQRTDPRTLPGLEAMMPGSALTRLLQLPTLRTAADLSVIAGDIEGQGLLGQLKLLAIDWFYDGEHDLVVNTGSMMGGITRSAGAARFRRDQGPRVSHFSYFRQASSVGWLATALARADGADAGFLPIADAPQAEPRSRAAMVASRAGSTPRPIAIVVPGTMGSALQVDGRNVWLSYWALLKGGLGDIRIQQRGVAPVDVLDDFYGPLIEHLARSHVVDVCPYDWRQSVRVAAGLLTRKLEAALVEAERTRQPVHLVAHSMGGLVARAMISDGGAGTAAWRRLTALPGSRLLMLGTPNRGSHEAVRWLTGFNPTQAKLALLDLTRSTLGVIDVVRGFPGLAELLPFDQLPSPWADVATWTGLKQALNAGWTPVDDSVLAQARSTWAQLRGAQGDAEAAVDAQHMVYVAGCQSATVISHQVVDDNPEAGTRKLRWLATAEGDGTVPWASGRLPGVAMYFAPDTGHDQLCSNERDRSIFRGYVDLLLTGRTDQLATTPPARRGAAGAEPFVLPEQPMYDALPDAQSVQAFGFGGTRARTGGPAVPRSAPLEVAVRHGDLRYARHPILVGHYQGDTIVSAEAVLDDQMRGPHPQGPLARRRDLGLYPGPLGSRAVFCNEQPGRRPAGALVIGLGQVGELSPGRLEAAVRDVLLDHAQLLLQRHPAGGGAAAPRLCASVSCLLVGTGAGSLTVRESVEALLRGALAANHKLEQAQLDQRVLIDKLEVIELYEDLAISAAQALGVLCDSADLGPQLRWPQRCLAEGEGRQQRSRLESDPSWWQRVEITLDDATGGGTERLRFVVTGDRARAEETLALGQLQLADRFIDQACGSTRLTSDASKTLFEMLLPNRLKEAAPDQRDRVLLLDEAAARFPWELLEDRWSSLGKPPAVSSGMVRQLKTGVFRGQVNHASQDSVLVVGNPQLDNWAGFADLPGARHEAEHVAAMFQNRGYLLQTCIDQDAQAVMDSLHTQAWRVLHLAGHGEHEFPLPPTRAGITPQAGRSGSPGCEAGGGTVSGMVIGPGVFLTPGDVAQLRHVPELVFINCCHLGAVGDRPAGYTRLAANLGVEFIRMGARAVVCAGWAVDDAAASTFAEQFYAALLAGDNYGRALLRARQATWRRHPDANTWGAYQCYGDPDYRLVQRDRAARQASDPPDFFAPAELVAEARNLTEGTRMQPADPQADTAALQAALDRRITALIHRVPADLRHDDAGRSGWLARADVCGAIGLAYGEGLMFAQALQWLERALAADVGDCPVRVADQWANLLARQAAAQWLAGRDTAATAAQRAALRQASVARIQLALDNLAQRPATIERESLRGSACKRLALVQDGDARRQALADMADHCIAAFNAKVQPEAYAFNNAAVATLLLRQLQPDRPGLPDPAELQALCSHTAEHTRQALDDNPRFWLASGLADLKVVDLLLARDDPARCQALADAAAQLYSDALARGASLREQASLREHLDMLVALTADTAPARPRGTGRPAPRSVAQPWPVAVQAALKALRDGL